MFHYDPVHTTEDVLECYILGRLSESAAAAVEEHLLVCERCRIACVKIGKFVSAARAGLRRLDPNVVVWQLHETEDGLVEVWVEKTKQGRRSGLGD